MATSYTSLLGFALPVQGELSGTWGDVVNDSITQLVEDSVAGSATASVTSGNWTLTTTGSGAANEARSAILIPTGTPGTTRNIVAPSSSKAYIVDNQSNGAVVVKGSATTGTTIAAGAKAVVAWNGSDFVTIASSTADGVTSVSGTGTVNGITLTGTVTSTGNLTLGGTLSGVNLTSQVTGTLPVGNGGTGATTLTGVVKGNGTSAFSAATAGTDYVAPGTATNFTAKQTFTGSTSVISSKFANALEVATVSATAATGTINYDVTTQSVLYYTTDASGNWTINFRASSGTSLDTAMATGEVVTAVHLVSQGATAYYNSAVTIDGGAVTPKWQGGSAPSGGNASGVDAYVYSIIKTGSGAFTVLASQTQFA